MTLSPLFITPGAMMLHCIGSMTVNGLPLSLLALPLPRAPLLLIWGRPKRLAWGDDRGLARLVGWEC